MSIPRLPTPHSRPTTADHSRQCAIWTTRLVLAAARHTRRSAELFADLDRDTRRLIGLPTKRGEAKPTLTLLTSKLAELEAEGPARHGPLFANVDRVGDALALSPVERDLLALAVMMATCEGVTEVFWQIGSGTWPIVSAILASGLDAPLVDVRAATRSKATLVATGLVKRGRTNRHEAALELLDNFGEVMLEEHTSVDALVERLYRPAQAPTLLLSDFQHVATDLALLLPILTAACRDRTTGFDVLLHGPPGTGKTELARVLAHEIGARLYEVNVADDDGDSMDGALRLTAWTLCQRVLAHKAASLVLFDEAEDVFPRSLGFAALFGIEARGRFGKGWMNRALETHPVPTLWISNSIAQIDAAYLRRFDVVVELRTPPPATRRKVLERHMVDLPVGQPWLDRNAADDRLVPAHVERAARAVKMLAPDSAATAEAALDRLLGPQLDRLGTRRSASLLACGPYDLGLVNASHDLAALGVALARNPHGSICLYGPSGTGKTAFVQHLATTAGVPMMQRRGSELLGMYVGQTEKNIAAMFQQARDERALLFLDEADSFLQDRSRAQRSFEVTSVNELLVQMEQFEGLFVCATNLVDSLDRAALRRFAVKIRFEALKAAQRWQMLAGVLAQLGGEHPEGIIAESLRLRLDRLEDVTAGDFAAVARQHGLMGGVVRAEAVVAALEEEVRLKRGDARRAVGFL